MRNRFVSGNELEKLWSVGSREKLLSPANYVNRDLLEPLSLMIAFFSLSICNLASYFMEQTMGLPSSHESIISYDKSDIFPSLGPLREKALMIIHGTADTKVNILHSMLLMKALTERSIPFRVQVINFITRGIIFLQPLFSLYDIF